MPKRGAFALGLTALALALLLNFQTPDAASTLEPAARSGSSTVTGSTSTGSSTTGSSTKGSSSTTGSSSSSGSTTVADPTPAPATASGTVDGPTVGTRFGPVQVEVTIKNGKITDVVALQLPSGGRSGQISQVVEPMLSSQALSAQSANIDGVSGATYTSNAYARSLQAALDDAGYTG